MNGYRYYIMYIPEKDALLSISRVDFKEFYSIHWGIEYYRIFCHCVSYKDLTWSTGLVVALICFTLFGIEQIGIEIENPFAVAPHNLPLDQMCNTMLNNIEDLSTLATDSAFAPTELF